MVQLAAAILLSALLLFLTFVAIRAALQLVIRSAIRWFVREHRDARELAKRG